MMPRRVVFVFAFLVSGAFCTVRGQRHPMPVIFDSDMGPDYDDVGAIALLHSFADSGKIKILATMASTQYEGVACVMDVFNTYFGRPSLPIGIPKGRALTLKDWQHWTDTLVVKYPHKIKSNAGALDAIALYRKVLSTQADHSVTIVTTGFLTNVSGLLKSPPDGYSKLDGTQLVKQKVKQLVCMAGRFPAGKEFNVDQDPKASQNVFANWPGFIIMSGFEIGQKIKTGLPLIRNTSIQNSPVKDVFAICIPKAPEDSAGRMSWDETAVFVAVKGYSPYYRLEYGKMIVADDGSNTWIKEGKSQAHLVEVILPAIVQSYINKLIMHQPLKR